MFCIALAQTYVFASGVVGAIGLLTFRYADAYAPMAKAPISVWLLNAPRLWFCVAIVAAILMIITVIVGLITE